jgi:flagellar assembly protein FliH
MFERSFDHTSGVRVPERKPVTLKPDQYDALRKECHDEGYTEGKKAGLDDQTAQLMALIAVIGTKIDGIVNNMAAIQKQSEEGMRRMALAIARKFLPEFTAKNGMQEIEALLTEVMGEMVHEPRLVVRVHESQFDVLNEKITALTAQKAYAGKIVLLADAEIAIGDCRVEWADGGMERNSQAMWDKIEKAVTP